jgi:DNA gyrase subunit B
MTKSHDDRADNSHEFELGGDIAQLVANLNASKAVIHDKPIVVQGESEGMQVDIAIQWNDSYHEAIYCFTNNTRNKDGGTHLMGAALTRTVNACAQAGALLEHLTAGLGGDDISEGLTAICPTPESLEDVVES